MKFDSTRAWREASAAIAANREVLLALAGVFFMLPWLAFMLLAPQPAITEGMAPAQAMAALRVFLAEIAPYLLPLTLIQAAGSLAVVALCADPARPTVGEAIRLGARGMLPYFAAMFLFAISFTLAAGMIGIVAGVGTGKAGALAAGVAMNVALAYAIVRLVLVPPVIALEGLRSPVRVLLRAWRLTAGNFWQLLAFLLLLVIAGQVIMAVIEMVVGAGAALVLGKDGARIVEAVASSALLGVFLLVMAAVLAAIHGQLAQREAGAFD